MAKKAKPEKEVKPEKQAKSAKGLESLIANLQKTSVMKVFSTEICL